MPITAHPVPCSASDCSSSLGKWTSAECIQSVTKVLSAINRIYLFDDASLIPSDPTIAANWNLDNETGIRVIDVVGGKPAPEEQTIEINYQTVTVSKTHTLDLSVFDHSYENMREFYYRLCCGWSGYLYYTNRGGVMFGGADDGTPLYVTLKANTESGSDKNSIMITKLTITWDAQCEPVAFPSPFA